MIIFLDEKNRYYFIVFMNIVFFVGKEELVFRKFGSFCDF